MLLTLVEFCRPRSIWVIWIEPCWLLSTSINSCWLPLPSVDFVDFSCLQLTSVNYEWLPLTSIDFDWLRLTSIDFDWLRLTSIDLCWLLLTCVDLCWLVLTCVDFCWLLLTRLTVFSSRVLHSPFSWQLYVWWGRYVQDQRDNDGIEVIDVEAEGMRRREREGLKDTATSIGSIDALFDSILDLLILSQEGHEVSFVWCYYRLELPSSSLWLDSHSHCPPLHSSCPLAYFWPWLTFVDLCWPLLTFVDLRWLSLTELTLGGRSFTTWRTNLDGRRGGGGGGGGGGIGENR